MVFYANFFSKNDNQRYQKLISSLPRSVIDESYKYHTQKDRMNFLMGRSMTVTALKDLQQPFSLEDIKFSKWEKPYFEGDFYFSLSHTNNLVVGCFSDEEPVGIDAQFHEPVDWKDYMRVLNEEDIQLIEQSEDELSSFYTLWTKKESIMKADGRGMQIEPNTIRFEGDCGLITSDQRPKCWKTRSISVGEKYSVSICAATMPSAIASKRIE